MSAGEGILHFTAIKVRVVGSGNLQAKFYSLDKVISQTLVPIPILASTDRQLTRLANFQTQRASLEIKTTEIDEHFKINRIIIFAKEVFTDFPSVQ